MDRKRPNTGKSLAPIFTKKKPCQNLPLMSHPRNNTGAGNPIKQQQQFPRSQPGSGHTARRPNQQQNNYNATQVAGQRKDDQQSYPQSQRFSGPPSSMFPREPDNYFPPSLPNLPQQQHQQQQHYSYNPNNYTMNHNTSFNPNYNNNSNQFDDAAYNPTTSRYNNPPTHPPNGAYNYQSHNTVPPPMMMSQFVPQASYADTQHAGGGDGGFQDYYGHHVAGRPCGSMEGPSPEKAQQPWGSAALPPTQPNTDTEEEHKHGKVVSSSTTKSTSSSSYEIRRGPAADHSLHCLTSSIQGARHWANYTNKLPVMFEIFGVLNSAVTTGNDGYTCSKDFLLRDDKDHINCIFYQIDRQLPKMVRGLWYRCVGHLVKGNTQLNCVTIREATDTEKKMHKTQISASDKAMRDWVGKAKET